MPGVINLKVEPQVLVPQIEVRLRPEAAERFGLTAGHVRRASTTLLKGTKVGEVYEGQKKFDVVVWGVPSVRSDLAAIRALPIDTPSGTQVRLGDVADVVVVPTPNEIKRENASRRLDITCNVKGRDLGSVAQEIEAQGRADCLRPRVPPGVPGRIRRPAGIDAPAVRPGRAGAGGHRAAAVRRLPSLAADADRGLHRSRSP